ncbi:MAG: methyltransferase domain-containing protein [Bacteroidia bacterium]
MKIKNTPLSHIQPRFDIRTQLPETMDDPSLSGDVLRSELDNLEKINQLLGGRKIVVDAIERVLDKKPMGKQPLSIADLGCGGGDILRVIATWAMKKGVPVQLYGLDFNETCIEYARAKSLKFPEIQYEKADVFSGEIPENSYDLVICSLFLHHFPDEQLPEIFHQLSRISRKAVIVNDLQRHWLPFLLFRMVTGLFRSPTVVRHDGLISIMRGFTRKELAERMSILNPVEWHIRWKWAFRFQLVFYTR